jgi:hypothetical protein
MKPKDVVKDEKVRGSMVAAMRGRSSTISGSPAPRAVIIRGGRFQGPGSPTRLTLQIRTRSRRQSRSYGERSRPSLRRRPSSTSACRTSSRTRARAIGLQITSPL